MSNVRYCFLQSVAAVLLMSNGLRDYLVFTSLGLADCCLVCENRLPAQRKASGFWGDICFLSFFFGGSMLETCSGN